MAEARLLEDDSGCLRLEGELSFATVPAMVRRGVALVSRCPTEVTVDLGGVRRADSAGLALMVEWMRAARRHGKGIVFRNMPAQMQAMARVSDLHHILPLA
ncbi:MAG TPA: anti-sigma factor antagonist [Gammaproteobacteria bacterium]|nr:anti-sigma factor antagonist [Gammaproteobacteria bacterium]